MPGFFPHLSLIKNKLSRFFSIQIQFGIPMDRARENTLVLLPVKPNALCCGLSALVSYKAPLTDHHFDSVSIQQRVDCLTENTLSLCLGKAVDLGENYLSGQKNLWDFLDEVRSLKTLTPFFELFSDDSKQNFLLTLVRSMNELAAEEKKTFKEKMIDLSPAEVDTVTLAIETLQDITWCLESEVLGNLKRVEFLTAVPSAEITLEEVKTFKKINAILNSIDRLEVRGRDSAGISLLFVFTSEAFEHFSGTLTRAGFDDQLRQRTNRTVLVNDSITINHIPPTDQGLSGQDQPGQGPRVGIAIVYKFAAEIGALGDNVKFLRNQVRNDQILHLLARSSPEFSTVSAHTRWASVGDITEANCHPVDNVPTDKEIQKSGIIHVCLNGDIDNFLELKNDYEHRYDAIAPEITTDTKIIPLQVEHYLRQGETIDDSFRMAVNDFHGSHAISMHTDLAPGKLFLARRGSGQALFIGIANDHYIAASELYGVVEETQTFFKLNGEQRGQIIILDQKNSGDITKIESYTYDSTPIEITESSVQNSQITGRDIDRQNFPHYFLKEISEAPISVEKTLQNKWQTSTETGLFKTTLSRLVISERLESDLTQRKIKSILFIGQGTAGIAAQGCAHILSSYLAECDIVVRAMKSSELSGFALNGRDGEKDTMDRVLVIAISQSGTTTDTNRCVDMVKSRGAHTLAIVNRRDSDLSFKADGVLYTSSGRDIEMSVASTKAFYSQITAGTILGLHLAALLGTMTGERITREIQELSAIPGKMRQILDMREAIQSSANRLSVKKEYWATVGSGSNKTSADEIRIKLSELCYKTISSDFVEDKKHIDLSSEPLIIVCAAGTRESVLGDIIKDTAIFHAHKAAPVVITTQGENRFDPYSDDVFKIPHAPEHLAPILNTLVGHLWGYYASLAINEGSQFMYAARNQIEALLNEFKTMGRDIYEVILEKKFRESIAKFYAEFSKRRRAKLFPSALGIDNATNITLVLKYLSGRLPVADFEMDFSRKGTPTNMLDTFFQSMGEAINAMARPVDAIKHQAKTVTVGTSRISETFEGIVFDELAAHGISVSQLTNKNVMVLKNLQQVIGQIKGGLLYKISGLTLLGEPSSESRIEVIAKTGILANEISRVENDPQLKGTKNIIVKEGNVYIGRGRKDGRSILVIPVFSSVANRSAVIENILSLNVGFKTANEVSLLKKTKALGGKHARIKDIILESGNLKWDDKLLDLVSIETLFGDSAEKIAEKIEAVSG
ncbi:MAG: SIS domain-containing protein [Desulfobacterium sp.]|nr:SIS domain-containing protein [Desulfobacterium sp.]